MPIKFGQVVPGTLESNRAVAEHLQFISMAMALEDKPNRFKVKAFEEAAESLVLSSSDVRCTDPRTMPGIGESVAEVIRDFLDRGTSKRFEDLCAKLGMDLAQVLSMTKVDNIGPKTALALYKDGIRNFDELVQAVQSKDPRVKERFHDAVLFAVKKQRVPHAEAKALALRVVEELNLIIKTSDKIKSDVDSFRFEVCGSIRRRAADSKDVDIVGCVLDEKDRDIVLDEFVKIGTKISRGDNRASIRFTHQGRTMQVDLWLVPPESYGSALNYATGSTAHNIELRKMAMSKGMLINEYGIFRRGDDGSPAEKLGGHDERDVYRVLGIAFVEPWDRVS